MENIIKATGITRPLDNLGRVVIPKELRTQKGLEGGDQVEIFTTEDGILLKKYQPACEFCGGYDGLTVVKGHKLCKNCINEIKEVY